MTKDLPRQNKDTFFSELLIFATQVGKVLLDFTYL